MRRRVLTLIAFGLALCMVACSQDKKPCLVEVDFFHKNPTPKEAEALFKKEREATSELLAKLRAIAERENLHVYYHEPERNKLRHRIIWPIRDVLVLIEVDGATSTRSIFYEFKKIAIHTHYSAERKGGVSAKKLLELLREMSKSRGEVPGPEPEPYSGIITTGFPTVDHVMKAVRRWRQAHNE